MSRIGTIILSILIGGVLCDDLEFSENYGNFERTKFTSQSPFQLLPPPQSAIGYESECGVRGGRFGSLSPLIDSGNKIVGGQLASKGEFPWQVSLQMRTGLIARHICGATIVSKYWVVTAGHCVASVKPRGLRIVAGEYDLYRKEGAEQIVNVIRIINNGYVPGDFKRDIALLQVSPAFQMSEEVAPICLPQPHTRFIHGNATVSGWGKLSERGELPHILHHVTIPLIQRQTCQRMYENAGFGDMIRNECQTCAGYEQGGSDACQGDSGGPLVCRHPDIKSDLRYYLCGVVSWGVGCARAHMPGVYTEVPCYVDWIKSIIYNRDGIVSNLPSYDPNN